ncbi:hypothetical protein MPH_06154 [Macrophomina phaseolina MS6]|uniref:Uncharacterized protein n=1 Tax=Macrophomina phaseolina (strain MS6) TaxID=1126212 RepID=K2RPC5_MACPH|nr:hypothetical protein MPH_06154 [Macrophomina phaseolina MS6]
MDKITRPKQMAKREQKAQALRDLLKSPDDDSDGDGAIVLSSSEESGDTEDDDQRPILKRQNRSSGLGRETRKPLYSSKKHLIDHLLGRDDEEPPSKRRKKIHQSTETDSATRAFTDTVHSDTSLQPTSSRKKVSKGTLQLSVSAHDGNQPIPGTYPETSLRDVNSLGDSPLFVDSPPSSIEETIQRSMEVIKEMSRLLPRFPAIEEHLKRSKKESVQVHEDAAEVRTTLEHLHERLPLSHPYGSEKENLPNTSEDDGILNVAYEDNEIVDHGTSRRVEDDETMRHGTSRQTENSERQDNLRSLYTELMPSPDTLPQQLSGNEPQEGIFSGMRRFTEHRHAILHQQAREKHSTENPPAQSQVASSLQPLVQNDSSSRTLSLGRQKGSTAALRVEESSSPRGPALKDTHLTLSQSAALDNLQIGSQVVEETQPPSEECELDSENTLFEEAINAG